MYSTGPSWGSGCRRLTLAVSPDAAAPGVSSGAVSGPRCSCSAWGMALEDVCDSAPCSHGEETLCSSGSYVNMDAILDYGLIWICWHSALLLCNLARVSVASRARYSSIRLRSAQSPSKHSWSGSAVKSIRCSFHFSFTPALFRNIRVFVCAWCLRYSCAIC